jgi:hypothetical protein
MDIKDEVGFGKTDIIRQVPKKASWRFWFSLVTRKIATGVGRAVKYLNDNYCTDLFNSQVLLWPGEENAEWIDEFPRAREEIVKLRQSIIRGALGDGYENAITVLDRILLPCFEFATDLRLRYDPEYCDGSLDYISEGAKTVVNNNIISDLEAYGYRQKDIGEIQEYATNSKNDMSSFMDHLDTERHRWLFNDKLALRAVRTMFHVNRSGVRKMFRDGSYAAHRASIDREIDAAAAQNEAYSNKLIGLRLHHQLTMLQIGGYKGLAKELAYSDQ